MSCLKPHYERMLRQNGNLALSRKTETQVKAIIKELEGLGIENITYRLSPEEPTFTLVGTLKMVEPTENKSSQRNWILEVRKVK